MKTRRNYLMPLIVTITLLLAGIFGFSQPENQSTDKPYVKGITSSRAKALAGVAVGVVSIFMGWRARRRMEADFNSGRSGALIALVLGLAGVIYSAIHLLNNSGDFGSGGGKAGAIGGIVFGLIGLSISSLALMRSSHVEEDDVQNKYE